MVVYSKKAFDQAQKTAREAVKGGTKNNMQLDWDAAMILLRVAYGHYPLEFAEAYYKYEG